MRDRESQPVKKKRFSVAITGPKANRQSLDSGIGLFLCREIITRHNGYIWVESENGKGAKILFTLPEHTA